MTCRKPSVAISNVRRVAVAATLLSAIGLGAALGSDTVLAQQLPPANPPAAPRPGALRPTAPKPPAAPAVQRPPAPAAPQAAAPGAPEMPQFVYTPWAKMCGKGNDPNAKEVCFTSREARTEAGQPLVSAALIEPEGEPKKVLRVTLPTPVQLLHGARLVIDKEPAISGVFFTCIETVCLADFDATPDLVAKLKKGQMMVIRAINLAADDISFPLPLTDASGKSFQVANEGPATDQKVLEEQQKKLQEDLQKRADEMRKKFDGQVPPK
jgi:invasion protein IalB